MAVNLNGKSFLKLLDFTPKEIRYLLDLSKKLKADKRKGKEKNILFATPALQNTSRIACHRHMLLSANDKLAYGRPWTNRVRK